MADTSVSLLCEASESELNTFYSNYFKNTHVKLWKVLDLFRAVLDRYKPISYDCVDIFIQTFKKFGSLYSSTNTKLQSTMNSMVERCQSVIRSDVARTLVVKERVEQSRSLYCDHITEAVLKDKTNAVTNSSSLSSTSTSAAAKRTISLNSAQQSNKRPRRLNASYLKALSSDGQLQCLAEHYGKNNILDLTSPGAIPVRFAKAMTHLSSDLQLPLSLTYTTEERAILTKTIRAKSLNDIQDIVKDIQLVPRVGLQSYIYIALSKLLLLYQCDLLKEETHKEGWYQGHLYADVFDAVFLFDPCYVTKRTECHATTIKYLRKIKQIPDDEKDVKVDLILFNSQLGDIFSCEDKPAVATEADVQADIKKGKDLREKRLIYIKSILPHESLISSIEVTSAQFHGLSLTIYGSRMTNQGAIIHYQKAVANLPIAFSPPEIAHFLLTVMSLQRAIGLDLKKLTAMYQVNLEDSISFLSSNNDGMFYRDDSPSSDDTTDTSTSSDIMEMERVRRILKLTTDKVNAIGLDDDLLSCEDWEDLLVLDENDS